VHRARPLAAAAPARRDAQRRVARAPDGAARPREPAVRHDAGDGRHPPRPRRAAAGERRAQARGAAAAHDRAGRDRVSRVAAVAAPRRDLPLRRRLGGGPVNREFLSVLLRSTLPASEITASAKKRKERTMKTQRLAAAAMLAVSIAIAGGCQPTSGGGSGGGT